MGQIEQAQACATEAQRIGQAEQSASNTDAVETRARQLSQLAKRLDGLRMAVDLLHDLECRVAHHEVHAEWIDYAKNLSNLVQSDINAVARSQSDIKQVFIEPVSSFTDQAEETTRAEWEKWINIQAPLQPLKVLEVLKQLSSLSHSIERVEKYRTKLEALGSDLPTSSDEIALVRDNAESLGLAWAEVTKGEIPVLIHQFLDRVGNNEALLSDVDDAVREWLDENGLLSEFAVVPK
ncbi:hypothetical protein ACFL51_00410 [Myxococcota bacterium]